MDTRPLIRRLLWGGAVTAAFLLLAVLGLALASLLHPGDEARPEPEAAAPPPRPPRPLPEPPPLPPPPRPAPTATAPPPPPPAPTTEPATPVLPAPKIPLPTRLRLRREILRDIGGLSDALARCPSEPVTSTPGGRAALVFETVAEGGAVRIVSGRLEADHPVNDAFVTCARTVLEGKRLPVPNVPAGAQLRLFIPIGPRGNSLALPAASVAEADAQ